MLGKIGLDKGKVFVEIRLELLVPRPALFIGGLCSRQRHGVYHAEELVTILKAHAQMLIADDDV